MMTIARFSCVAACVATFMAPTATASAQSRYGSSPAVGETFVLEVAGGLWNPTPELVVSSSSLGIEGSDVDFVRDLGAEKKSLKEFRAVLKLGRRNKLRVHFTPVEYIAEGVLSRRIVFNGTTYDVGLPVNSLLDWSAWRFGYEFDIIVRDRGFLGVIAEAKYTKVTARISSPVTAEEETTAKAPIPALGVIGRVYPLPNVGLTAEFTGFKLPGSIAERENAAGSYYEWDLYGTLNVTKNFGVQGGYRSLEVNFVKDLDYGDLRMSGPYVLGVVRF
jgi:hypothetical protein